MFFECGDIAENCAFVFEEGTAPLDGFDDTGTGFVNQFADMRENGLRKGFRLGNVCVDARFKGVGGAHVSLLEVLQISVTALERFEQALRSRKVPACNHACN